ncbi:MBL fold metallo-hydrolase [Adlercreutzia sp. R21]|uniref:MBL fold metallo-hydrolase n=1 Tax=Adlercreutzia wanghongyangiae TaxID=3111451 RepID=UPI002DBA8C9F|nr:MBL fold metallo-hydrolase [Adlercreutzia sp. R21]MEC4183244.1 MBL fold metallo-hydrolase [Adlercreutzia sp. R21]
MVELVCADPAIYRIHLPFANVGAGEANCHVLRDGNQWLIVDTAAAGLGNARRLQAALRELGVDFGACQAMLTHGHFDHAGVLPALLPASVPLFLSPEAMAAREPARLRRTQEEFRREMRDMGASSDDARAYGTCNAETAVFPAGRFAYRPVADGDEISVGRCRFRVMETPGHTPDHLCFYEPDRGILFAGDHVLPATTPAVDAHPDGIDGLGLYLRHMRRVRDLPVRLALFGHGDSERDGAALIARINAIVTRKRSRTQAALAFLHERGGATGQEVARCALAGLSDSSWRATRPIARYYFMLEALVVLRHLRATGRAERLATDGRAALFRPR